MDPSNASNDFGLRVFYIFGTLSRIANIYCAAAFPFAKYYIRGPI